MSSPAPSADGGMAGRRWREPSLVAPARRLRRRLDGFRALRCLEGYRVRRALAILVQLRRLTAPRVMAAYLRTICDGWSTHKRYQGRGACRFGCPHEVDSLFHIARCPIAVSWAARFSHLRNAPVDSELDYMLCLATEALDPNQSFHLADRDEMMITRAIHLYALYKVHNQRRHGSLPSGDLAGAYRQHLVEGRLAVHI